MLSLERKSLDIPMAVVMERDFPLHFGCEEKGFISFGGDRTGGSLSLCTSVEIEFSPNEEPFVCQMLLLRLVYVRQPVQGFSPGGRTVGRAHPDHNVIPPPSSVS
ncbi:hypothetical protein AVEN_46620-1 [Araneus ventricosus]|uniref:Uncharacterized protein n=1 Tax=Araneus ventricosus TaxID=182803 RepID=A0A4Y2D2G7_ARAVE|nr:hypothetical protein AVEN_46620-1 [Araneus ventricosus]